MPGKLPMHLMRCADKARQPVPTRSNGEFPLQDDGGTNPGAPKGNRNAFMHGRSTAEAIASRREVAALIRATRARACVAEEAS
jgi:hypothetical protein